MLLSENICFFLEFSVVFRKLIKLNFTTLEQFLILIIFTNEEAHGKQQQKQPAAEVVEASASASSSKYN